MIRSRRTHASRVLSICLVLLAFAGQALAALPRPMDPPRMVNDFAALFSTAERDQLETLLQKYHTETTTQIYVVTVKSLEGQAVLPYATKLGNAWGVGQAGKDNGIVLLIKPKIAKERGEVAIALGSGVTPIISQRAADGIIENGMLPLFRKNLYAEGVQQAAHTMGLLLRESFTPGNRNAGTPPSPTPATDERAGTYSPPSASAGTQSAQPPAVQVPSSQRAAAPSYAPPVPAPAPAPVTIPAPSIRERTDTRSSYSDGSSGFGFMIAIGLFAALLIALAATGHGDVALKLLMGIGTVVGVLFLVAAAFGGGGRRGGGGGGGGGFSGGGGGSFSGGGSSGSW